MTLFTSSADEKIQGQDHLRECNNATPIAQYMVKEIITKMKDIQLFVCMCIYVKKANGMTRESRRFLMITASMKLFDSKVK